MKKNLLVILAIVLCVINLNAQTDTTQLKDLNNCTLEELLNIKIITASKISQKATDAPATVYVITKQQIEERNYSCLKELLNDVPQIEIQKKSIAQKTDIFVLNGVAGNEKFLILMDGIRISSTTGTDHTINESYTLANTKQYA